MYHWYRWLDETHSGQGSKPKSAVCHLVAQHLQVYVIRPTAIHFVIVLSSYFRFQVSTNHMVDAMASSLVENKPDCVKHLLVLTNHSDRRCTWGLFALLADFAQVSYSHNES